MSSVIPGIHHVTVIAGEPQANIDFYTGILGLRLVKVTVNFDMPNTYHLYYGDHAGSPGTIFTVFCWAGARRGRPGAGQITTTSFAITPFALPYWTDRLSSRGITVTGPISRFDEEVINFADHDGLRLELVARSDAPEVEPWHDAGVPAELALRGFHGVTIAATRFEGTDGLLNRGLGFTQGRREEKRSRYVSAELAPGRFVDVIRSDGQSEGTQGIGSVHHVAFRTSSEAEQLVWRGELARMGVGVTPVRDRSYFKSIYFVEPSGVLYEIATDPPGFATDETVDRLGSALKLPPWLEAQREVIAESLLPIRLPEPRLAPGA